MPLHDEIRGPGSRVVVTGLGVASPLGCSIDEFWMCLLSGKSGMRAIEDIDVSRSRTRIGAQVVGYDPVRTFPRKELQRLSRSSQLAIVAAREAIGDAGLEEADYDPYDTAVILGTSIGCLAASESFFDRWTELGFLDPLTIPVAMNLAPASNISLRFGLKGPLLTIDAACAASSHAIGHAYNLIKYGIVPSAVTGGADSPFSPAVVEAWCSLRALSERNETPTQACRPFSRDRDGLVLGEHAGILVLESETSARRRNAHIYAEISGYGATSDSHHITQPSVAGPTEAMRRALRDANLPPDRVDYINAHATATLLNDRVETEAIKNVFGPFAYDIPVVGIKPAIGHSLGATGALEFISCVLSIRDHIVPPTLNVVDPDPDCDLDYVTEGKREWDVTHAISNSFAFGGSNAVLVASRYAHGT